MVIAGDTRVPALSERLEGFHDGVRDGTLDPADQLVLTGTNDDSIRSSLTQDLADPSRTAVIACSTPLAVAGLRAVDDSGRTIPDDIAFATFDGFDNSDLFRPQLTTVRQPAFDMGLAAVRLLMERLDTPESSPRTVRLRQKLELRESTEGFRPR